MSIYCPLNDRLAAILVLGCWSALAQTAHADVIIIVDTAADVIANDGACSLREAITAANNNANYFGCIGTGGGYDLIEFSIGGGTPVINIATVLPTITGPVEINGGSNRVELRGDGLVSTGLSISGPGTAGSVIRKMVINRFSTGIYVGSTTNIVISGNYLGTTADGIITVGSGVNGIDLSGSTVQIGGINGITAGGPCTGDCNLISGYTTGTTPNGIRVRSGSNATIRGNFIGTDANGTNALALGNGNGIRIEDAFATVGGTTAGAGNLISGNVNGIIVRITAASASGTVIQGNRIGTNASGSGAIPNGNGVDVNLDNRSYPVTIGGSAAGAGNLISGNASVGIFLFLADHVAIYGNRIGTQANGTGPLPNAIAGIQLSSSTHLNVIGGIGAGEGNVIAHNGIGVRIGLGDYHNSVRGNSIYGNVGKGIQLDNQQENTAFTPSISGLAPVTGTACAWCTVDVFSDAADEGGIYQGTVLADGVGNWSFNGVVAGPFVTATATSLVSSTSEFSGSFPPDIDGDGVPDPSDNCTLVSNPTQCDSDADGYGNHCDGDLNNNTFTNSQDYILFRAQLGLPSVAPIYNQADLNCNGFVNSQDYILFRQRLGQPSGPSGLHP